MQSSIVFSVMNHGRGWSEHIQSITDGMSKNLGFGMTCQQMEYDTGLADFMRNVLHGSFLDVSEMGTSWINDFAAMNSLHPFSPAEIRDFGGVAAFPPALWHSAVDASGVVYAIPWMTYLSLVYYRPGLLKKAGVDESDAFSTPEKFENTLACLARSGNGEFSPWAVPTSSARYDTLHDLEMWLWYNGTDVVDSAGKKVLLGEPNALRALESYFGLYRYVSPKIRKLNAGDAFARGEVAVMIAGPAMYEFCKSHGLEDVGVAIPLGQTIVGGSSLVLWKSSKVKEKAIKLISLLSDQQIQASLPKLAGMLPGRVDMLEHSDFSDDGEVNRVLEQAIKTGRAFPQVPLVGMIEERLSKAFEQLWSGLLSSPEADVDQLLEQIIVPVINRINITISQ